MLLLLRLRTGHAFRILLEFGIEDQFLLGDEPGVVGCVDGATAVLLALVGIFVFLVMHARLVPAESANPTTDLIVPLGKPSASFYIARDAVAAISFSVFRGTALGAATTPARRNNLHVT